jgi:hypothetical protein
VVKCRATPTLGIEGGEQLISDLGGRITYHATSQNR